MRLARVSSPSIRISRRLSSYSFYQGQIGIADAAEVKAGNFEGSAAAAVRLMAAVGSAFQHNDDVPDTGAALVPR